MESREPGRVWPERARRSLQPGPLGNEEPRRILIARLGAIGDCLRVLPAVASLRRAFPRASIGWVVGDLAAPLLEGHPAVDRFHVVGGAARKSGPLAAWQELRRVAAELRQARYDVAVDLHTRLKSGYLVRASRAPLRIGVGLRSGTEANFLFTNCHVELEDRYENRVLRFFRILAPLGLEPPMPFDSGLWLDPVVRAGAERLHREAGRPDIAIFAGASAARAADRWPASRWREVALRLGEAGFSSMVIWGPGDGDEARSIAQGNPRCSVAPATSLGEMMALLGLFRLYAGTNTAALHMAWMQRVPAVVVVGGRPWRTDRPLPPVPSVMLTAGGIEPSRKRRGRAAREAVLGVEVPQVVSAALGLLGWSAEPSPLQSPVFER